MFNRQQIGEILELIGSGRPIVITAHKSPDADALGSALGLYFILSKITKAPISMIVPDSFPDFLDWMPGSGEIKVFDKNPEECYALLKDAGLIFCLDYNHPSRTGNVEEPLRAAMAPKVMIDHHQQPDSFAKYIWSDTLASSTSELIVHFLDALEKSDLLDRDISTCLYTGIMSDTGSFRFSATTAQTHRIIARLMETGFQHWKIHEYIFNQNSLEKLQLWGHALANRLFTVPELRTSYIRISANDLIQFNYREGYLEGLVNYALSIKGTVLAVLFTERKDKIRISFRSVGDFNVNKFAREYFNGGGHINAAGGSSDGTLDETVQRFLNVLPEVEQELLAQ